MSIKSEKRHQLSSASRNSESVAQAHGLEGNDKILAIREVTEEAGICRSSCPAILAEDLELRRAEPDLRRTDRGGRPGASTGQK
jgi:hypothetical protein